eukprot:2264821-Pleurochrysis_carterae.AAC.4
MLVTVPHGSCPLFETCTLVSSATTDSADIQQTAPLPARSRNDDAAITRDAVRPTNDSLAPPADTPPDRTDTEPPDLQRHFQRGLGAYPLRNRASTALLTVRDAASNPAVTARNTGCAFVAHASKADPKTRKQALRDDRAGRTAAERAEIANHAENGSWELINRTSVPAGSLLVRLIWVYKQKQNGSFKARLCVQGCAQIPGVDFEQTFAPRCALHHCAHLLHSPLVADSPCDGGTSSRPTSKAN